MNLNKIIYSIIEAATDFFPTGENRLNNERLIEYMVHEARARGIREEHNRNDIIDQTWVQDMGKVEISTINEREDLDFTICEKEIGKIKFPRLVSLSNPDLSIQRISSYDRLLKYYPATYDEFFEISKTKGTRSKMPYYIKVGDYIYIYPYKKYINAHLILQNPLDGFLTKTEKVISGEIEEGYSYTVISGSITYNLSTYSAGQTFTGTTTKIFTGIGDVRFTDLKRPLNNLDPYPINAELLAFVKQYILKEIEVGRGVGVPDIETDAIDKTVKLKNEK